MKAGITAALLETGLYPQNYAVDLHDVIEVDSFAGQTQLHTQNGQDVPMPRVSLASRGSMLNLRFTGPDSSTWHTLYYHHLLDNGFYIATRGFTPLSLEVTDEDVDKFVRVLREFLMVHLDALQQI
jgi:glutamate-1-semialdehyde 2,1-aminomutase